MISFSQKTGNPKVNFELVHPLDLFRHKAMRARLILQSATNVVQMLVTQSSKLSSLYSTTTNLEMEFTHLISDLQDHIRTIDRVTENIQVTKDLVSFNCHPSGQWRMCKSVFYFAYSLFHFTKCSKISHAQRGIPW